MTNIFSIALVHQHPECTTNKTSPEISNLHGRQGKKGSESNGLITTVLLQRSYYNGIITKFSQSQSRICNKQLFNGKCFS